MTERYRVDKQQAEHVAKTALYLLDQVADAWKLEPERSRKLVAWAAHLYEIGLSVSHTGYQKHGAYLVENSDMAGFSRLEQSTLAVLVGGHRRKIKPELFMHISKKDLPEVKKLLPNPLDPNSCFENVDWWGDKNEELTKRFKEWQMV